MTAPDRVLVVDDDELIRTIARAVLEKAGMRVDEAGDGGEALALLGAGDAYALVIVDLDMPGVDGIEVLRGIRTNPAIARLPVVVLTGSEAEQDEARVMAAGADDYVRKPIVPDQLLTRVRSVLRRAPS